MSGRVRFAHLSDLHLAPIEGFDYQHANAKRVLGYLNWVGGRGAVHQRAVADVIARDAVAQAPDLFLVTGDLANLGLSKEFETALSWLALLGPPERVLVVPGNHDIYTDLMHGPSCLETWAPFMRGDGSDAVAFPFVRRCGDVVVIALNSAVPTPPFVAQGELGGAQIEALERALQDAAAASLTRVVALHHPPLPGQAPAKRALRDADAVAAVLARTGAELVVHGHNHRSTLYWGAGPHGRLVPVSGVASGSAGLSYHGDPLASYKLFDISRDNGEARIVCTVRGLDPSTGEIEELQRFEVMAPGTELAM